MFVFTHSVGDKRNIPLLWVVLPFAPRPCQAMCPEIDAAKFGLPRVVSYGLSPQERVRQVLQITTRWTHGVTLPSSLSGPWPRAPTFPTASSNAWTTSSGLNTKRNQIRELNVQVRHVLCGRVRAVARSHSFGLQHFFCIWCAWPDVTLPARMVNGFRVSGDSASPLIFRQRLLDTPSMILGQVMAKSKDYVDSLGGVPDRSGAHRRTWPCTSLCGKTSSRTSCVLASKFVVGKWLPLLRFAIELDVDEDHVSNFGAIDNGAAANTIDLASAESELHLHTTTLDVIASVYNCMYGLWAESHSVQIPDARV